MTAERLAIAKGYPYDCPRHSYLFVDGEAVPLGRLRADGRVPVLAIGSNRALAQLARKYRGWPAGTTIPVTLARLTGHDVVHSAHFTGYGAIPAMLHPSPGVTVEIAVTWLTDAQLARMHQTEGTANYRFARLDGLRLEVDGHGRLDSAWCYLGRRGAVCRDGAPVPLAAVEAAGRRHAPLRQAEMLAHARDLIAPKAALDPFILETIACAVTRAHRTRRLGARRLAPSSCEAQHTALP